MAAKDSINTSKFAAVVKPTSEVALAAVSNFLRKRRTQRNPSSRIRQLVSPSRLFAEVFIRPGRNRYGFRLRCGASLIPTRNWRETSGRTNAFFPSARSGWDCLPRRRHMLELNGCDQHVGLRVGQFHSGVAGRRTLSITKSCLMQFQLNDVASFTA